jgi:hypothetical protein
VARRFLANLDPQGSYSRVANLDLDPVGFRTFWSDPDPGLNNDSMSTLMVCVKAINTLGISVA